MSGKEAYVEDIDDSGEVVGARRTAKKQHEVKKDMRSSSERRSPEKAKEKYSQSESRRAKTSSTSGSLPPPVKRVELKQPSREERRKSSSSTSLKKTSRPPSVHQNVNFPQSVDLPIRPSYTQPIVIQQPPMRAITHHPRPSSYHEGVVYNYPPPLSSSAYAHHNSLIPAPSYPPPGPSGGFMTYSDGTTYHANGDNGTPPAFRQDFYTPIPQQPVRTLAERFGGPDAKARRRLSIYSTGGSDERGYESSNENMLPRKSSLRKTKAQMDAELMPPPLRRRENVRYAEDVVDAERYASRSRPVYRNESLPPQRRPSNKRHSQTYTYGSNAEARIVAEGNGRPKSYYGVSFPAYDISTRANNFEENLQAAEKYQNSVGGPTVRLTAETLKKASRRAHPTSSHSTRSSESRDESEQQRSSVTTRTTGTNRTGAGDEDITIKLKGQGKIKIAGAEIEYDKDTELNIRRGGNIGENGSQRSSEYGVGDERRNRMDRGSERSRLTSHSNMRISRDRRYHQGGMF